MPKRYTYITTCIKETPIRWGIELVSLGDAVPPRVVRFPGLTQPLTKSPYFQSGHDPMAYFRQLVKGMPEMLRGYNARTLKPIQTQLDQLQVGGCCHVKVSYIDNGENISPYNYSLEMPETPSGETYHSSLTVVNHRETDIPFAAPSMHDLSIPTTEEVDSGWQESGRSADSVEMPSSVYEDADPIALIAQLHEGVRKLQSDMNVIKGWLAETLNSPNQNRTPAKRVEQVSPERIEVEPAAHENSRETSADLLIGNTSQARNTILDSDERSALEYIINQRIVTESQLAEACHISRPIHVMTRLIEKMEQANFPWISVQEDQGGGHIYIWNQPNGGSA